MPDVGSNSVSGVVVEGYRSGATTSDNWYQYVVPVRDRVNSFTGRAASFATLGLGTTAQQNLLTLVNGSSSTVTVSVNRITVDLLTTAAAGIAPSVVTPIVRVRRCTAVSGGTALTKVPRGDSAQTSNANVVVSGGTASDGGAATAITATNGGLMAQKFAPRTLVVGTSASTFYEPVDTVPFFYGEPDIVLKAGEGLLVSLEGVTAATGNPTTNRWICEIDWDEWTRP